MAAESSSSDNMTTTASDDDNNNKQTTTIEIQLTITAVDGSPRVPLLIGVDITASKLLESVANATKIPIAALKLIYRGRLIKSDENVVAAAEYKLEPGSVIHCMGKPIKEEQVAAAVASASTSVVAPGTTLPSFRTTTASSAAAAATTTTNATTRGGPPPANVTDAIATIRSLNPPDVAATAITTLDKLLNNIIANPLEIKYRRIKKNNAAFNRRLGQLPGGHGALLSCGFAIRSIEGEEQYELTASEESWDRLLATKQIVENALSRQPRTTTNLVFPPVPSAAAAGAAGTGGMGSLFPPGMMGNGEGPMMNGMPDLAAMNSPEMQAMVQQFLSNPSEVQAMLQNPMVQNMLRSDPRFANNPMAQQALSSLQSNPQAIAQMSRMFSAMQQQQPPPVGGPAGPVPPMNPQAMAQLMAAMRQQPAGGGGGTGGVGGLPPPPAAGNDLAQTEEEMIEEAIRRSLQDQSGGNNDDNDNNGNGGNN